MMDRHVVVTYSEDLLRRVVWKFWLRVIGPTGFIATALLAVGVIYFLLVGDRTWFSGFLLAVLVLALAIGYLSYRNYLTQSLDKLKQMGSLSADMTFKDDGLVVESGMGRSEIPWRIIERAWIYPNYWLIFVGKNNFFTIPMAAIGDELQHFLRQKLQEIGAKIE